MKTVATAQSGRIRLSGFLIAALFVLGPFLPSRSDPLKLQEPIFDDGKSKPRLPATESSNPNVKIEQFTKSELDKLQASKKWFRGDDGQNYSTKPIRKAALVGGTVRVRKVKPEKIYDIRTIDLNDPHLEAYELARIRSSSSDAPGTMILGAY